MIRPANPAALPTIVSLIRRLADYENLAHAAVLDEPELGQHLFGPRPAAEILLAEQDGESVGFALYFPNFSTFLGKPGIYLEDIFVKPDSRGQGHGKALLTAIAKLAVERGCGRVEWSVLDWNEPSIRFYRGLGAVALDEWTIFRLTGPALAALGGAEQARGKH
jgi:GNAT superfamily N-acetyltransferase